MAGALSWWTLAAQTAAYGDKAAQSAGFPPFDPEYFAAHIMWFLISFGLLYLILAWRILPKIGGVIEERADRIRDDLDLAARASAEAEDAKESYERQSADAKARARAMAADAKVAADKEIAEANAKLDAEIAAKLDAAQTRIAASVEKARGEIKDAVKEGAGAIVSALTPIKPGARELTKAAADALKDTA